MNKTVNINLAGIFFHIDEDAYNKLQHYLDAVKRSFTNTQGSDEIIADIEARIAELFNEKVKNDRQVISIKEVEEVITIMGQPEDYMVDEEIFDDEPAPKTTKTVGKQLFRDTEHSYVGGVSSGLGHYLNIDAIWIRILWILLTIFSSGAFVLIYLALWIFVPEAKTTADKLAMRGEEVTISNIEKKIREGFDNVADKVKDVDYQKYGNQARQGAGSAASALGRVIRLIINVFVKLVGVLLLIVAGFTLISLFIGLFTVGTFGIIDAPWSDYIEMATSGAPLWLLSLLTFFAVGIPFFFLFILGLKILVRKLKSIGTTAKLVLLGLWLLSVIGLAVIGVQQATHRAFDGEQVETKNLNVSPQDTLYISMRNHPDYSSHFYRNDGFKIKYDENNQKVIYSSDVRLSIKSTKDSVARLEIVRSAEGKDFIDARDRARNISYGSSLNGNELQLDAYFTTPAENRFRDQEIEVSLYLPEGMRFFTDSNLSSFYYGSSILNREDEERYMEVLENTSRCLDCPAEEDFMEDEETFENEERENKETEEGETNDPDQEETEPESDEWDEDDDFKARQESESSQVRRITIKLGKAQINIS